MVKTLSAAVLSVVLAAMVHTPAQAAAPNSCSIDVGSFTAAGNQRLQSLSASSPPRRFLDQTLAEKVLPMAQVRMSGPIFVDTDAVPPMNASGNLVIGSALYRFTYKLPQDGTPTPYDVMLSRIGGGWDRFVAYESAKSPNGARHYEYALRNDGTLFRWSTNSTGLAWTALGTTPGFGAVKAMTVISETSSYDTLLMNTRGGALYTVRIPVAKTMRPVVTKVRASTWQGFETLHTARCGQYGTLLVGIDKDTGNAYEYAVGHAAGTSTVIQSHYRVPSPFTDPIHFRSLTTDTPPLNGE